MRPEPNVFSPSSIDEVPPRDAAERVGVTAGMRLALAAWAATVYGAYWLGYLGLR